MNFKTLLAIDLCGSGEEKIKKSQKILTDSSLLGSQLVKVRISWGSRVSGDRELAIERTGILNKEYIRNVDCGIHVKMACSTT